MNLLSTLGRRLLGGSLLAMIFLQAVPAGAVEEFHAFLAPDTSWVQADSVFTVHFAVDSTAHHFNGFTVLVSYDSSLVDFISVQRGALMQAACPNHWTVSADSGTVVFFEEILLCGGVFANGPGDLAVFTFRAKGHGQAPLDIVSSPDLTFYDAGRYVSPSHPTYPRQVSFGDARVIVYDPLTGISAPPAEAPNASGTDIDFQPNPARDGGVFRLSLPEAGHYRLEVFDVTGRLVFDGSAATSVAGRREIRWDCADVAGRRLPGGVYFARLETGADARMTRVVVAP